MAQKKTPVQEAFKALQSGLDWDSDERLRNEQQEFVFETLAQLAQATRLEATAEIAARLDFLGNARMDYVHNKNITHSGDIEAMGGMQATVYGEATGAKWLARIIRGESDRGWLPSWRW